MIDEVVSGWKYEIYVSFSLWYRFSYILRFFYDVK